MKNYLLYFFAVLIWTASLPFVSIVVPASLLPSEQSQESELPVQTTITEIFVLESKSGNALRIPIEDYAIGVLSAEMPENAGVEAQKAMAVAARTYAIFHIESGDKRADHEGCDVCDDPMHCRAFTLDFSQAAEQAVAQTAGEMIYYNKAVINPVFHIASSLRTESAQAAFGVAVPYLQSVETPDDGEIDGFFAVAEFTKAEFYTAMRQLGVELDIESDHKLWIGHCTYTEGGRVNRLAVGDYFVTGAELAMVFKLQSRNIVIREGSGGFIIETEGIGHGAGLSQYGACLLAEQGMDYRDIIRHYYTGVYIV